MRSLLFSAVSAAGLLLLACALSSAPAAAQTSCTVTYDCQGSSGCSGVMGGNVTTRTLSYASQSACDSAAAGAQHGLPTIKCSCGGGGGTSDTAGNIGQLISTMTPQQQMGVAMGAVGTLMVLKGLSGLMQGKPAPAPDPAAQQRALAAQQLNNSGIYLMKQKNYSGAINEFQQALAQTPNDANIANNLALAKRQQKNTVIAGQTSGTLGQVLGVAPAGNSEYAMNSSPLNLVNLNNSNNSGAGDLRPPGEAPPANLQGQIDSALGNQPPAPAPSSPTQAQDIDQILGSPQPAAPSAPPQAAPPQSQIDAEQKQVDDLFKSSGSTPAAASLVQQAKLGQAAANAPSPEEASAIARQGFDTAAPVTTAVPQTNAPQAPAAVSPPASSDTVDLRQTSQATNQASQPQVIANLKAPAAPAPEYPITVMRAPASDTTFKAAGSPIFDCEGDRAIIKRMASGLPAQDDAIRRTEEAMKAAKEDSEKAQEEAQNAAVSTMLASAGTAATWAQTGLAKVGAMRSNGFGPEAAQYKMLARMKEEVLETTEHLHDLLTKPAKAYKAGYAYGNAIEVEKTATTLRERLEATEKFMKDSGIQDQFLENWAAGLALTAGGPVGGLVAEGVIHSLVAAVDLYTNAQKAWNSAAEAEQAERDLEVMRDQQLRVRSRIYELQQEVAVECSNTKTAGR